MRVMVVSATKAATRKKMNDALLSVVYLLLGVGQFLVGFCLLPVVLGLPLVELRLGVGQLALGGRQPPGRLVQLPLGLVQLRLGFLDGLVGRQ